VAIGERYDVEERPLWSDGNEPPSAANPNPLPRGYYPVRADGTIDTKTRLRWVDGAPGNPDDGTGWFEEMPREAGYGYYHGAYTGGGGGGGSLGVIAPGPVAPLQAIVEGTAETDATEKDASPWARIRYFLGGDE